MCSKAVRTGALDREWRGAPQLCRRMGIYPHPPTRRKLVAALHDRPDLEVRHGMKYGGMGVSEARRLKSLEEENRRPKRAVAELTLDNQALKDVLKKGW